MKKFEMLKNVLLLTYTFYVITKFRFLFLNFINFQNVIKENKCAVNIDVMYDHQILSVSLYLSLTVAEIFVVN